MRTVRRTGQFRVVAGVFGRVFTVIERTEFTWIEGLRGPEAIPGLASLETTEGYALKPVGDDRYEIAALGLIVQRISTAVRPTELSNRRASAHPYQREQAEA